MDKENCKTDDSNHWDENNPKDMAEFFELNTQNIQSYGSSIHTSKEAYKLYYDRKNIIKGSCGLYWDYNKNKKGNYDMPNLQKRNKTQPWNPMHTGVYVIAGTKMTFIDKDNEPKCQELARLCKEASHWLVKSKKGFHA